MDRKYIELVNAHNYEAFGLLYPDVKVRAIRLYQDMWKNYNWLMRCTSSYRGFDEQNHLYDQGRTTAGQITTNVRGGESYHNYGCAIDSCFSGMDPYLDRLSKEESTEAWNHYGHIGEAHGFKWGKKWLDLPHLQMTYGGLTILDLQELYKIDGLRSVWAKFDKIRGVDVASEYSIGTINQLMKEK